MATAGPDVVGVDWRVPLDEARRRVGPGRALQGNLDPALCLAPWPVVDERRAPCWRAHGGSGAGDGTGTGHVFNLGPRRAARDGPGHPGRRRRAGPRGDARGADDARVGVLVMAHGTPAGRDEIEAFYTRIRRGGRPRPSSWPSSRAATRAIGGVSPLAERTAAQVDALRGRARDARAPGRYVGRVRRQAHRPAHRGRGGPAGRGRARRVIGLVLTPHALVAWARRSTSTERAAALGATPFVPVGPWYAEPGAGRAPGGAGHATRCSGVVGTRPR